MKLQSNILLLVINKYKYWLLSFLFLFIISYILVIISPSITNYQNDFLSLIAYPKQNISLISIYQIILYFFLINRFLFYDMTYAYDYVLLRANDKRWLKNKMIIALLGTIIFKSIYIGITYFLFSNELNFELIYLLYPNIFLLVILFLQIFNLNFPKIIGYVLIAIESPLLIYLFLNFSLKLLIIFLFISFILIIFTVFNFKFKKVIR